MKKNKSVRLALTATVLMLSQLACQTLIPTQVTATALPAEIITTEAAPTQTNTPNETPQFSDDEIRAGIQKALDIYAEAYTNNRPELLETVVDQENKPFRRIVRSRFDDHQGSYLGGQVDFEYTLIDITRRENGFVLARIDYNRGWEIQWPFRYQNGTWVISEPSVEQIGEPVTTETEHFIFTSYPWADDVNPQIMSMMDTARQEVQEVLGKVPEEKANVKIMPIYGLDPFDPMGAVASYNMGSSLTTDLIKIYTPNSFGFSFYDPAVGWETQLQDILTHEYTHMTHARSFDDAGKLADWMSEGLAEYVAGQDENSYRACDAMESGTFIPIMDESGDAYKQDLLHMYLLEDNFGLSYDFATSLVEFTVEEYGGLDAFWKLAETFDQTSDFKKAVQEALGVSYDEYNETWQTWLKEKC